MTVKERLREFIKHEHISERQFCLKIGVSASYISSMRVSIQPDKLECIAIHFPSLNTSWLLTGEGEMLKNSYKNKEDQHANLVKEQAPAFNNLAIESLNNAITKLSEVVDKYYRENEELKEKLESARREINELKKQVDVEGEGVENVAKNCG